MNYPEPEINAINQPYWDGLKQGELRYQHCDVCDANWLPPREACPSCLAPDPSWQTSAGRGHVVSWVVYHIAYHEAFKDRVPYDVTIVELEEGPRLLSNIIDSQAGSALGVGIKVELAFEQEGELALARFRLARQPEGKHP